MRLTLKRKVVGLCIVAALLPLAVMYFLSATLENKLGEKLSDELTTLARENISQITKDAYTLCKTTNDLMLQHINQSLDAGSQVLQSMGPPHMGEGPKVPMNAVNAFSGKIEHVDLPRLYIGDTWIKPVRNPDEAVPLVDEVQRLSGVACSLYQRMNPQGDMLRLATTLLGPDGNRAIGEFIPAIDPEGTRNEVLAKVLEGKRYEGFYLREGGESINGYVPLVNEGGEVIGMAGVILLEDVMGTVRRSLLDTKVGKTGYLWVLGTSGRDKGRYIISKDGARDGEDLWDVKDSDGNHFVQIMTNRALATKPGVISLQRYPWINPGDPKPRMKLSAYTLFKPWNWIIGAGVYEDEYFDATERMHESMARFSRDLFYGAMLVLVVVVLLAVVFGARIAGPISYMSKVAGSIAQGDISGAADELKDMARRYGRRVHRDARGEIIEKQLDETGQLYMAMRTMTGSLNSLVGQVQRSGIQVTTSATEISASARQLESTVSNQATATSEVEATTRQISATARDLSATVDGVRQGAAQTAEMTERGQQGLRSMSETMDELIGSTEIVAARLGDMNNKAEEIVSIITAITKVADQTNLLSLNAAIEAEKAGEYGLGFAVVAREIRRLADQTAVAALDIEHMIDEMRSAVGAGVSDMRRFTDQVKAGAKRTEAIRRELEGIMEQVQQLTPRFEAVSQGMENQSDSAEQITEAMRQLSESAGLTAESSQEFNKAASQLTEAVQALQGEVSRFKVG